MKQNSKTRVTAVYMSVDLRSSVSAVKRFKVAKKGNRERRHVWRKRVLFRRPFAALHR